MFSATMIKAADLLSRARDRHTVVVAELPDGRQFRVTGYERAAIRARHPELVPLQVNVIVSRWPTHKRPGAFMTTSSTCSIAA